MNSQTIPHIDRSLTPAQWFHLIVFIILACVLPGGATPPGWGDPNLPPANQSEAFARIFGVYVGGSGNATTKTSQNGMSVMADAIYPDPNNTILLEYGMATYFMSYLDYADFTVTCTEPTSTNACTGFIQIDPRKSGQKKEGSITWTHSTWGQMFTVNFAWNSHGAWETGRSMVIDPKTKSDCDPACASCDVSYDANNETVVIPAGNVNNNQAPAVIEIPTKDSLNPGPAAAILPQRRMYEADNGFNYGTNATPTTGDPNAYEVVVRMGATVIQTTSVEADTSGSTPALTIHTTTPAGKSRLVRIETPGAGQRIVSEGTVGSTPKVSLYQVTENDTPWTDLNNDPVLDGNGDPITRKGERVTEVETTENSVTVSHIRTTEAAGRSNNRRTTKIENLLKSPAEVTTMEYYAGASGGVVDSIKGDKLKKVTSPSGAGTEYNYAASTVSGYDLVQTITEPWLGSNGGKVTEIHYDHANDNELKIVKIGGTVVSKTQRIAINADSETLREWSDSTHYQDTLVEWGKVYYLGSRLLHGYDIRHLPDGRFSLKYGGGGYWNRYGGEFNGVATIVGDQITNATGTFTEEIRVAGEVTESRTTTYENGVALVTKNTVTTVEDEWHRPKTQVTMHGTAQARTITKDYSCCGLSREIDENGRATWYVRDELGRVRKTHSAGQTIETIYNGNQTDIHRYAETIPTGTTLAGTSGATAGNLIKTITTDEQGRTLTETVPSPTGSGYVTTSTSYNDAPGSGLSLIATTTLPAVAGETVAPQIIRSFYLDGSEASTAQTGRATITRTVTVDSGGLVTTTVTAKDPVTNTVLRTGSETTDWLGRTVATSNGTSVATISYNAAGLPDKTVDPDGVVTLFDYADAFRTVTAAIDVNRNDTVDPGTDRIKISTGGVSNLTGWGASTWAKTGRIGSGGTQWTAETTASLDGTHAVAKTLPGHTLEKVTASSRTFVSGGYTLVTSRADGTTRTESWLDDLLDSWSESTTAGTHASGSTTYDAFGLPLTTSNTTLPGTGQTTTSYVSSVCDLPATSTGADGSVLAVSYDARGRVIAQSTTKGGLTKTKYYTLNSAGDVIAESGDTTPVTYGYDALGRRITMTLGNAAGTAVTRWVYDLQGNLVQKLRNSPTPSTGTGDTYSYTAAGRPLTKTSARGIVTTRAYNNAGEHTGTSYSDGTLSESQTYDEFGRIATITDAAGTRTLTLQDDDLVTNESISGGILNGASVTNGYDGLGRQTSEAAVWGGTNVHQVGYTYDALSRLGTISSTGGPTATFSYDSAKLRQTGVSIATGSGTLARTFGYASNGRRTQTTTSFGSTLIDHDALTLDGRDRVTQRDLADGTAWVYAYDSKDRLTGASRMKGSSYLAGYDRGYSWDDSNNLLTKSSGGSNVTAMRTETFGRDVKSFLTGKTHPGSFDVHTLSDPSDLVEINGTAASSQTGPAFHEEVITANGSGPVLQPVDIEINGILTTSYNKFVPAAATSLAHDADGNLLSDGKYAFQWDAKNRLTKATTTIAAVTAGLSYEALEFAYDSSNRMIQRERFTSGSSTAVETVKWIHAGNLPIAEIRGSIKTALVHGPDISGGGTAGGPGGLLWTKTGSTLRFPNSNLDGSVTSVTDASGNPTTRIDYDPFGNITTHYGEIWHWTFGSKFTDPSTGLVNFGLRWFHPELSQWLSEDPIGEAGGLNLFGYLSGNPAGDIDVNGMSGFWESSTGIHLYSYAGAFIKAAKDYHDASSGRPAEYYNGLLDFGNAISLRADQGDGGFFSHLQAAGALTYEGIQNTAGGLGELSVYIEYPCFRRKLWDEFNKALADGRVTKFVARTSVDIALGFATDKGIKAAASALVAGKTGVAATVALAEVGTATTLVDDAVVATTRVVNLTEDLVKKAPLSHIIDRHAAGQGFSGVFSPITKEILMRPSNYLNPGEVLPEGYVSARGGHLTLSNELGRDVNHVGFTAFLEEAGTMRVEWLSRSVNGPNPNFRGDTLPEALRASVIEAIKTGTGRNAH